MRKLNVFESISVDGYFVDGNGRMDWAHGAGNDPEFDAWVGNNANGGGELLFGRKTYEMMAAWWPSPMAAAQMPEVAAGINATKKYVLSRTLEKTEWNNSHLLEGDGISAVKALKESAGPVITVLGSGSVVAQLGEAGLVDSYQFVIIPVALGAGRAVFTKGSPLKLVEQRTFPSGRVVVTYAAA